MPITLEPPMNRRNLLLGLACAVVAAGPVLAQAPIWPTKPVRIVVAYPPGGSTDIAGRLLADRLTKTLGQQVVVENRGGAGGTIGAQSVVRADPDGYTLLLAASPEVSIAPITMKAMPYDPVKDLVPITLVGVVPFFLVANPGLPANTLAELIAYAKANPGKINYSSYGNNTSNHLVGELFKATAGISTVHVPYKGSGPSIIDLMGGQVQYTFDTPAATLGHVKSGKLKAIAVATPQRITNAPNVPTMSESGLTGFVGGTWFGLLAPARTPQPIVDKIHAEVVAALQSPELRKAFEDRDIIPGGNTADEFGRFIQAEVAKWRDLAAKVGIVAE
jgi:tripartite-type tricarboxylate transporter receptor subunit TctC